MKRDTGKARWDWMPWDALSLVASVMTWGALRGGHDPRGYLDCDDGSGRYLAAACRHISEHQQGRFCTDPETDSGLPHLAHAAADLLMVLAIELKQRRS